jgi:hypothetical protein
VGAVTRYNDGRTGDVAGAICDEGCHAISIGGKWTLSCANRNDSQQQSENQSQTSDCDKTFHDDLLYIDSKFRASYRRLPTPRPVRFEVVNNQRTSHPIFKFLLPAWLSTGFIRTPERARLEVVKYLNQMNMSRIQIMLK